MLAAPLGVQSVSPQVDSLVARTLRGDSVVRTKLGTGDYRLVVRVKDTVTGQESMRERRIAVWK